MLVVPCVNLTLFPSPAQMIKPNLTDSAGVSVSVDYISTKASRIPRLMTAKWNAWLFGHNINVMEVSNYHSATTLYIGLIGIILGWYPCNWH